MKVLLNGIGRIGKSILRISQLNQKINIVAINELNANIKNIAYIINYDSTYGNLEDKYIPHDNFIQNTSNKIEILNENLLENIDYSNIDIIIDASGVKMDMNILNSLDVKKVFLTHPNKEADINIILGVNEDKYDKNVHKIISTSSCNASSLLPVLKLIDDEFEILVGDITTIHPLLNHQKVLDSTCVGSQNRDIHCNFEFGRSSLQNIIPSATTTVDACSYVLNNINNELLTSSSFRVPTPTVGAINVSLLVNKKIKKEALIKLFEEYEKTQKFNIFLNNKEALVSSDFVKSSFTSIIDQRFIDIKKDKLIKLVLWYDNEYGYASRVVDIVKLAG